MNSNITSIISLFLFTIISVCLSSCENADLGSQGKTGEKVNVNIFFSDFKYEFDDDDISTRASDKTPSDAGMNRISLSVFASDNTLAFSTTKNASVDVDDFDKITCSLLPGDYRFVAVVHKANDENEEAVAISSPTQATLTTSKIFKVFAVNQSATILADQTNDITIDLGKRISTQFQLKPTDPTPSNVVSCEIILNPSSSPVTTYVFNPTTGLASDNYQYRVEFTLSEMNLDSFKNILLGVNCFVTENPQNISVTVNMKDASGAVIKSRTFTDVPMAPHRVTRATGSFFNSSSNTSFVLDNTDDPMYNFEI